MKPGDSIVTVHGEYGVVIEIFNDPPKIAISTESERCLILWQHEVRLLKVN